MAGETSGRNRTKMMQLRSLKTKISLTIAGVVVLLGAIVVTVVATTLSRDLGIQLAKRGVTIAKGIAQNAADHLLAQRYEALQMTINDAKAAESDIEYVFVVDVHGSVAAHTFGERFPSDLRTTNMPGPDQDLSILHLDTGRGKVLDIAIPIFRGDVGVVHAGISEDLIDRELTRIIGVLLASIAGVFVIGIATASAVAARITRPLHQLVDVAHAVGQGDLARKAPVASGDEIGVLGSVFNRMTEDLSRTLVSKDELNRAYEFTKTVIDSMNDAIAIIDVSTRRIIDVNRVFLEEAGMTRDEVIGATCHAVTHGRDAVCEPPDDACPLTELLASGRTVSVEHVHRDNRGDRSFVEISVSPLRAEDGRIAQAIHVSRDVTKRKTYEQEMVRKHDELQELFNQVAQIKKEWELSMDCTDDMIMLVDETGRIKRCNRTMKDFAGMPYRDLLGRDWSELLILTELINGSLTYGTIGTSIELFHEPSKRWFVLNRYPYRDEAVGVTGQVLTLQNITQRKSMTDALELKNREIETNRAKLEAALTQIEHLILQVTRMKDFSVRFSNPHLQRCSEVMGCTKTDCPCYDSEDRRCWQIAGTFCGTRVQGQFAEKIGNCSQCPVFGLATSDPIYKIGESFNNMMHILEIQHTELVHAYNDLKVAQSQITQQEKMASIGQLAAGVAHEVNNPTGFIMSNLGTLQKYLDRLTGFIRSQDEALGALPAERTAAVADLRRSLKIDRILADLDPLVKESLDGAERIRKIVQDLKSFSRVDEAELKMADLNAGIESTINIVWNELKYKAALVREYGELPLIRCNPGQLNQVFMNILVNAAHAIHDKGEIRVRTGREGEHIMVAIADTGCGIPPDKVKRIFEPFFTTKPVGKGTGLGLSIAYDIIKKHQGTIDVDSAVGKGTTFTIRLPLAPQPREVPAHG